MVPANRASSGTRRDVSSTAGLAKKRQDVAHVSGVNGVSGVHPKSRRHVEQGCASHSGHPATRRTARQARDERGCPSSAGMAVLVGRSLGRNPSRDRHKARKELSPPPWLLHLSADATTQDRVRGGNSNSTTKKTALTTERGWTASEHGRN